MGGVRRGRVVPDGEGSNVERGLMLTYLAIRAVHVGQAVICVASGWSRYRRPKLAAAAMVACGAESAWVAHRCRTDGTMERSVAGVDVVTGLAGLVAMAAATQPEDRTT